MKKLKFIINRIIFNCKFYYAIKKERLIDITYIPRGIGKTYKLIKLAKKHKYPIIVRNKMIQDYYKNQFNFTNTYLENDLRGRRFNKVLIEEGVTKIREIQVCCNKIITGYYSLQYYQ